MISSITKQRGFTLVETIVYAAGMVLIVGVIVSMLYYSYSWYGSVAVPSRADQVGTALVDRIIGDIRGGKDVTDGASIFNQNIGALSLSALVDSTGLTIPKYYALQNGRIIYQENGGAVQYLTPSDMNVSVFYVNKIRTSVSIAIRFSISMTYTTRSGPATSTYAGMAILRNSYQ